MHNRAEQNKVYPDKTDWKKVISQSDAQNTKSDPDSPILTNRKYYKPKKSKRITVTKCVVIN